MKNGYTFPLSRSHQISFVENKSLGMSGSCLFPRILKDMDLSGFDFVVVDFCVNEENFAHFGLPKSSIENFLKGLCGLALAAKCLPVFLLWPRKSRRLGKSLVHDLYIDIARSLNVPFFDACALIELLESEKGIERNELFKDDGHLAEWIAIAIGSGLNASLDQMLRAKMLPFITKRWDYPVFRLTAPMMAASGNRRTRGTSLINGEFAVVKDGDILEFQVPPGSTVDAISLNLARTSGVLVFDGEERGYYDFRNDGFSGNDSAFLMSVLPLHKPVRERGNLLRVSVLPATSFHNFSEVKRVFPAANLPSQSDTAVAEIEFLVIREQQSREAEVLPSYSAHRDLSDAQSLSIACSAVDLFKAGFVKN